MKRKRLPEETPPPEKAKGDDDVIERFGRVITKCDHKIVKKCHDLVLKGVPVPTAIDYLGISNTAFHNWVRKGEEYRNNGGEPKEYKVYGAFVMACRQAFAAFKIERQTILQESNHKNWYREVVLLERLDKKNWSKSEPAGGSEEQYDPDEKFD